MYNVQCVQSVGYSKFRYSSSWGFKMWRFKIWGFKIWVFKLWVIKVRGFKIKGIQNLGIQNHGESKSGDSKSGDSKSRGFKIWGINGSVPISTSKTLNTLSIFQILLICISPYLKHDKLYI